MYHRTKFGEDRSNRSGDMADFRFFKMAAADSVLLLQTEWCGCSVCRSVGHIRELCKMAEPTEMPFGGLSRVGPKTMY